MIVARGQLNSMWASKCDKLVDGGGVRFTLTLESSPVSYLEVLRRWRQDAGFRSFFNTLLANCQYSVFRWETPAITATTAQRPFQFALLDSPGLDRTPNPDAFARHFSSALADQQVMEFPNLGGDAVLVVPCVKSDLFCYGHIGAFVRSAPESQCQALWESVGVAMERRVNAQPVWLSTAGAGVPWLHVRLDNRPKYYGYEPYRSRV
jgi:hypothetical protein